MLRGPPRRGYPGLERDTPTLSGNSEAQVSATDTDVVYAHTLPGFPPSEWETLDEHADRVAALARSFAAAFGAEEWGNLLGLWHDLGKRSAEFQQYIRTGDPNAGEEEAQPRTDAGRVSDCLLYSNDLFRADRRRSLGNRAIL